jgi:hypothetical protein
MRKREPNVHFLLNGQKKVNRKKSRRRCFIGQLLNHNIYGLDVTFSLSPAMLRQSSAQAKFPIETRNQKSLPRARPRGKCRPLRFSFILIPSSLQVGILQTYPKTFFFTLMPFSCRCP